MVLSDVSMSNKWLNTTKSVLSAFLGVQSNKNRQRDFAEGTFSHFVIIGLIVVILFIAVLISIVSFVVG
jgi:hypothetical protein